MFVAPPGRRSRPRWISASRAEQSVRRRRMRRRKERRRRDERRERGKSEKELHGFDWFIPEVLDD